MKRFPSFVNECSENAWGILIVASSKSRVRLFRECLPDCDALSSTVTSPQSARAESYQLCCEIVATDRFAVIRHLTSDRSRGLQSICGSGHQAHLRLLLLGVKVLSFDKTNRALSAKFCSKADALSGTCEIRCQSQLAATLHCKSSSEEWGPRAGVLLFPHCRYRLSMFL
jgi:hypothetical protein